MLYNKNNKSGLVSIVIPTFNSKKTIKACIDSIINQNYPNYEIIIIDNNSLDGTLDIIKKYDLKLIIYNCTRSEARNNGIKRAKGEYILSIDSDMILQSSLLQNCISTISNENADALIIPEISIGKSYFSKVKSLEKLLIAGESGYESARFFNYDIIASINFYDEKLVAGEDYNIQHKLDKLHFKTSRVNDCVFHDEGELTFSQLISKFKLYSQTIELYRETDGFIHRNQDNMINILIKKRMLILNNLLLIPGFILLQLTGYIIMKK